MPTRRQRDPIVFLPELIEPRVGSARPWTVTEVDIQESSVDLHNAHARVPKPHTEAQKLARKHEAGHLKYTPRDWTKRMTRIVAAADPPVDPNAVLVILKMLEENRIDWLLWSRLQIDLRPAREVLDWGKMPDPTTVLGALGNCLQLAWTVWASRGLSAKHGIPDPPPTRPVDPDTAEYFDKNWQLLTDENLPLAKAMIAGCMRMYQKPTNAMRDKVAAELAEFFPLQEEKQPEPKPKPEEQEEQDKAEQEEQEAAEQLELEETGIGGEPVTQGDIQIHDHTANLRRPSMRIARRHVPVSVGVGVRFAHRYMLDKAIFSQRLLTEAGIMIDGSSSMRWTDDDMKLLMDKLPAVKIGLYSGLHSSARRGSSTPLYGRICILAKDGRFAKFTGLDPEMNGGNDVDYEALQLLARWPKPRLWLSDGLVCGGKHGDKPGPKYGNHGQYFRYGLLHELCDTWMKAHEILRVPDTETMHKLLRRERVTLYRTSRAAHDESQGYGNHAYWPDTVQPEPMTFQL